MKKFATLILGLALCAAAFAQSARLSGTVRDSANQPVVGAFIVQQGTSNGTMTDEAGAFSLSVPSGSAVEISCIGYEPQTITVTGDQALDIVLRDDRSPSSPQPFPASPPMS